MIRSYLLGGALILPLAGGLYVYNSIDTALNYAQVEARIVSVDSECHLESTKRYGPVKVRRSTAEQDCAEFELEKQWDKSRSEVLSQTEVTVLYRSPADNAEHIASYSFKGNRAVARSLEKNTVVRIYASKRVPESIKPVS